MTPETLDTWDEIRGLMSEGATDEAIEHRLIHRG